MFLNFTNYPVSKNSTIHEVSFFINPLALYIIQEAFFCISYRFFSRIFFSISFLCSSIRWSSNAPTLTQLYSRSINAAMTIAIRISILIHPFLKNILWLSCDLWMFLFCNFLALSDGSAWIQGHFCLLNCPSHGICCHPARFLGLVLFQLHGCTLEHPTVHPDSFLSVFLCPPDPFLSRFCLSAAFSPARRAGMRAQYRVSVWAGYEIVKVRWKGFGKWSFEFSLDKLPSH